MPAVKGQNGTYVFEENSQISLRRGARVVALFKGLSYPTGAEVAIKFVKKTDIKDDILILLRLPRHENLVELIDVGSVNDEFNFLVMEWLVGESLMDWWNDYYSLYTKPPTPEFIISLARQALMGLEALHAQGFIMRDADPGNWMLINSQIKIIDLDTCYLEGLSGSNKPKIGKLSYMCPEQIDGEEPRPYWDCWTVAVGIYFLISGNHPFPMAEEAPTIQAIRTLPLPKDRLIARRLHKFLQKATSKNPADRYASAGEMLAALNRIDQKKRGIRGWVLGTLLSFGVLFAAYKFAYKFHEGDAPHEQRDATTTPPPQPPPTQPPDEPKNPSPDNSDDEPEPDTAPPTDPPPTPTKPCDENTVRFEDSNVAQKIVTRNKMDNNYLTVFFENGEKCEYAVDINRCLITKEETDACNPGAN
jgi:serine/threonine protein kinase